MRLENVPWLHVTLTITLLWFFFSHQSLSFCMNALGGNRTLVHKAWSSLSSSIKKKGKIFANLWFWLKCAERDISVTGTHFLVFQMNQTMEHPYRTAINHVIEYDDLSSSQDLPDTFGNDVNRYIFLYKYTSHLDAIIYFMWLSYFLLQILQSLILAVFTSWFSKAYLNNC